jgi:1-acyl-sn-glycerol-3-phosphate acyltransferase
VAAGAGSQQGVETAAERWRRRALTLPLYGLALALLAVAAPLLVALVALVDLSTDRRFPRVRCVLFALVYLTCEVGGLIVSGLLWLWRPFADPERWIDRHYALQTAWAGTLFRSASWIFGFRTDVRGDEAAQPGPLLVFIRHASVADTLLAAVFLTGRHGLKLRYVLKRELLWDPCLDVVGQRIPNLFVRRNSGDPTREIEAVRALAEGLGVGEGMLIYPEGTRFTPAKRVHRLRQVAEREGPERLARAERLEHVLPPRLGGPLALVDACPEADVLIVAHSGFEGIQKYGDTWRGGLIGRRVTVQCWRVARDEIPTGRAERARWLDDEWARVDEWVGRRVSGA